MLFVEIISHCVKFTDTSAEKFHFPTSSPTEKAPHLLQQNSGGELVVKVKGNSG
jgi:hypothetical protein